MRDIEDVVNLLVFGSINTYSFELRNTHILIMVMV